MAKMRLNIAIEENLKNYIQEKSEELGISMNGFISIAIAQHKQQEDALKSMNDINKIMEQLKQMNATKEL